MKKILIITLALALTLLAISCPEDNGGNSSGTTVVTLSKNTLNLELGEYSNITASTNPPYAVITWTSSNPAVATVSAPGRITGVSVGTATITAKAGDGGKATCAVTVTPAANPTVITLDPTTITMEVDEFEIITATLVPANRVLTWTSGNQAVATVNTNGRVTGVSAGTSVITASTLDGGRATCNVTITKATKNYVEIEEDTLVHYLPPLLGVGHFGTNLGTNNSDGSYIFGTAATAWSGGGAQYSFPTPKATDTWKLSDYQIVEIHLKATSGSVTAGVKKSGGNTDLKPIPNDTSGITFNAAVDGGVLIYKTVIGEAGAGIGFQRNTGGPATVAIEKVVFSKTAIRTISFSGGSYTGMAAIDPIKIPDGRTVNFGADYAMPSKPKYSDNTKHFDGWQNKTDNIPFDIAAAITKDLTLEAIWANGPPPIVNMGLNLNPASWGQLPPNAAITGGSPSFVIPAEYADSTYADGVLTLKFDGRNRQRAIIPLNADQIEELMDSSVAGVTFRLDADVAIDTTDTTAKVHSGEFRMHLGDPSAGSDWNATVGTTTNAADEGPLANHLTEYRSLTRRSKSLLGWFILQAMYAVGTDSGQKDGFAKVTITIRSISVEKGDTTQ